MARRSLAVLLSLGAGTAAVADARSAVTPVQKVVQMMESMLAKGKQEKQDEQVQFASYRQFCTDTSGAKTTAIEEATEELKVLSADVEMDEATAKKMTKEVAEHEDDISVWTGDQKAATKVRTIEREDYDALHADYSESVDALERAIEVLKDQAHDRKQAEASLVQVRGLNLVPDRMKQMVDAFLQDKPAAGLDVEAPEAAGYEFQSSGVVEMMSGLHEKFTAERTALEKEEMNSRHAYEMLMQDLSSQISQAEGDRDEKAEAKAKALQRKAVTTGDLKDTAATKSSDEAYLADLDATCDQKARDFEARQTLRAEELEAINKAIEIISGSQVTGAAEKHLPSFAQRSDSATALVSVFMGRAKARDFQLRAVKFLQQRSQDLSSPVLLSVAGRMSSDPFGKVKKMIKDLIVRLLEEANDEAEHKGWCDKELATNAHTRQEKADAVESLAAEIDELESSVVKLTEDVATLSKEITQLDEAVAEATKLREEESEKHGEAIAEAEAAQAAVAQALTVLKEFYAKAGEATALIQRQEPEAPEIFDAPYRGMGDSSTGVVGMLEVIESDFARLEADTKAAEATSKKEYNNFMEDSKVDKASKQTDIKHKSARKGDEAQALVTKREDLEGNQKELDAAMAYFDKLKPSCVDAGVSYEDRVVRRKEEIESLQESLRILDGEDLA